MRNIHIRTCNMARKLKNVENEKHKLQDLEYVEKTDKQENEKIMVGPGIWQETLKKRAKCETHPLGPGKLRETVKM